MVGEEVVVKTDIGAAPNAAVAVRPLGMGREVEAFGDEAPLDGHVAAAVERHALIHAPACRAVIDDDIIPVAAPQGIFLGPKRVAQAKAQIAQDDVVGIDHNSAVRDADTVAGSALTGDGEIPIADLELALEPDGARDAKNHGALAFLGDCLAQGAGSAVLEGGHLTDDAAASAAGIAPRSLGTGKGGGLGGRLLRTCHDNHQEQKSTGPRHHPELLHTVSDTI